MEAPPQPPTVVTGSASSQTQSSATLNATVNPNGGTVTDCHFEYGTSTVYGTNVPCTSLPGSGGSPVAVSAPIESLSHTIYHFRIVATNVTGTGEGADQKFTTEEPPEYGRCLKSHPRQRRRDTGISRRLHGIHVPPEKRNENGQVRMVPGRRESRLHDRVERRRRHV